MIIKHNRAYHAGKSMGRWFNQNGFWFLALITAGLTMHAVIREKGLAATAFGLAFILCIGAGVYYANRQFTQEVLTEYDKHVQRQLNRKGFRVIKGGKNK